jgi:tetratricopeptide (TPR) repeat protein
MSTVTMRNMIMLCVLSRGVYCLLVSLTNGLAPPLCLKIACYRAALRINPRHYNAWSGLGHVYHQQEKYKLAEYHFKRALCINPVNTLLLCFLGNVQRSMCNFDEALVSIEGAISLDPSNPQAK